MVDKTNKWVIDIELGTSKVLSEYESMLKKMKSLEEQYQRPPSNPLPPRPKTGPYSKIGSRIAGGEALDVDLDHQIRKLSRIELPTGQAERFKDQLGSIQKRLNMAQSSRSVKMLRKEFRETTSQIRLLEREQQRYNRELRKAGLLGDAFSSSLKRAAVASASIYALGRVGGAIFRVGREMDSMRAGLLAASGSAEIATSNFEFLKDTAQRLGTDIQQGVSGFNRIAVAAKGAGLSVEEARHIFLAASESATTFQLDNQRTGLVMLAFSQMMSKGKVSMEELSRQLGENLPITLKAAEMATGKTTAEVIKLIESGKLLSKDFIIPFSNSLRKMVREAGALEAATKKMASQQKRMNNAWKVLVDEIFQEKGASTFGKVFKDIADIIEALSPTLKSVSKIFLNIFEAAVSIGKAIFDILDSLGIVWLLENLASGLEMMFDGVLIGIYKILIAIERVKEFFRWISGLSFFNQEGAKGALPGSRTQAQGTVWNPNTQTWVRPENLGITPRDARSSTIKIDKVEIKSNTDNPQAFADEFTNRVVYNLGTGS